MSRRDRDVEARIEQLVELEQELTRAGSTTATTGSETGNHPYAEGTIAGASKVPAGEVPADYPVAIETEQALRIDVDVGPDTVRTYMEWHVGADGQGHVGQLLDALDREPGEFADVFGDRVALDSQDGYYGIDAERTAALVGAEAAREDPRVRRTGWLLAGLLGISLLGSVLWDLGVRGIAPTLVWLPYPAIPVVLYFDRKRLRRHLPSGPGQWWIGGCLVPVFHFGIAAGYLVDRLTRLRAEGSGQQPSRLWHRAVQIGTAASLLSLLVAGVSGALGLPWALAIGFLPVALYYDAVRLKETAGWPSDPDMWGIYGLLTGVFLVGWLLGGWHLLKRRGLLRGE